MVLEGKIIFWSTYSKEVYKVNIKVVSLDMACTVFFEEGCYKGWEKSTLYRATKRFHKKLVEYGFNIGFEEVYNTYLDLYKKQLSEDPWREHGHLYRVYKVLKALGIKPTPKLTYELYKEYIEGVIEGFYLPREHRAFLEDLKALNLVIVLSTDTGSHEIPLKILERTNTLELFDAIISSALVGYTKASIEFYKHLLEIIGTSPEEIIHVGDNVTRDFKVPRRIGINSILFRFDGCKETDPKPCISKLSDLLNLLRQ